MVGSQISWSLDPCNRGYGGEVPVGKSVLQKQVQLPRRQWVPWDPMGTCLGFPG